MKRHVESNTPRMSLVVLTAICLLMARPQLSTAQPCNGHWVANDPISTVNGAVSAIVELPNGDIAVAGSFSMVGTTPANNVAIYHPSTSTWSALGSGTNGITNELQVLRSGDLIAGGSFSMAGGTNANNIARWDGVEWLPLGLGIGAGGQVYAILELQNGDLIAGGSIMTAGGVNARGVARWNGSGWSSFSLGLQGIVFDLSLMEGYEFVAAGDFSQTTNNVIIRRIAAWNGSDWVQVGAGLSAGVRALATIPNGDLIAVGSFMTSGAVSVTRAARWNGLTWSPVVAGSFLNSQNTMIAFPSSEIVTAAAYDVHRFKGGPSWVSMPGATGSLYNAMLGMRNGDILLGASSDTTLIRWTDSSSPHIAVQPQVAPVCGMSASLLSIETSGQTPISYQWQIEALPDLWRNLPTTPMVLPCGGMAFADQPQGAATTVFFEECSAAINVRCALSNACGSATSNVTSLVADVLSPGDVDGDGLPTGLDIHGFAALLGATSPGPIGFCAADLDHNGVVDINDVGPFVSLLIGI